MESVSVAMIRERLAGIPQFPLPPPYSARWHRPGDEAAWLRIHRAADALNTFPEGKFREQFGDDHGPLARRQLYLSDALGREIGTATAWRNDRYRGRPFGRLHWVAIVPEEQGRGLAKPLLTLACNRLLELGHESAYLTTNTARTAAVNLYLKFGFVPDIRADRELEAWRRLREVVAPAYWAAAVAAVPGLA